MSYNMVIIFRIPVSQLDDIALFYNDAYSLYLKSELTQSVYVYVILTMFMFMLRSFWAQARIWIRGFKSDFETRGLNTKKTFATITNIQ